MLFDSYVFIFCFLPITLIGFFLLSKYQKYYLTLSWLVLASLLFYAWWDPRYLVLLLLSICINYLLGMLLWKRANELKSNNKILFLGITLNLIFLGYFKYFYFCISNLNEFLAHPIALEPIILPLGISFFTFQKIAFLVDASKGKVKEYRFLDYCLFVSFFPQLIAGPIVQHAQFIPQVENKHNLKITSEQFSIGLTIFVIGLIKKIALADGISVYANNVFNAAAANVTLSFWEAWLGSFAYALQLYFDFSGYSDMAIGLAYFFGIKLPINFFSPYKARNIIDFWRRWHITLSSFLKNYLYIPIGGNRKGTTKRYINLFITMILGGLWHGANWTFLMWGALHGSYLIINHFWKQLAVRYIIFSTLNGKCFNILSHAITFLAVVVAWVPFRAENVKISLSIFHSMFSLERFYLPNTILARFPSLQETLHRVGFENKGMFYNGLAEWPLGILWIVGLAVIALFMPNTVQLMSQYLKLEGIDESSFLPKKRLLWRPSSSWAIFIAILILMTFMLLSEESEFLYFQF